ncbi:acyl transferase [Flavihumibacter stibioxidans]|nr:acyl transferase [Flavihumibacter stibioxidans]
MSGAGDDLVLDVFRYQYENNDVYKGFSDAIGLTPRNVKDITGIPFLPIRFFKSHAVQTGKYEPEEWFESSGTTGTINSQHLVRSLDLYRKSFTEGFRCFYGEPRDWCIIGLLPAYLERQHSSLVVMVDELIKLTGHPDSGFYLYDYGKLADTLGRLEGSGQKTLLIGVTFALLDFAEQFPMPLRHTTVMETGGMKGRRREITRSELHDVLAGAFNGASIHSEYGMTELLSQAYSGDNGLFYCPPWMKVLLREEDDPLTIVAQSSPVGCHPTGGTRRVNGVINVIDLANIDSCSFIATDDMGKMDTDGGFEVLGRVDNSDIRGCSLMTI